MVRKFVIEIMVLILLMGGSFGLLEFLFRDVRNDYDRRFDLLQQRYQTITRINIGNSHIGALMNYGPDSASCINLSFGGQDIFHCYSVLKTCIPHMPELKTVVFGLDYDLLGYDYIVANERWKDRQYYPYTGELYDNSWSNIIQARSAFFRSNRDFGLLTLLESNKTVPEMVYMPVSFDETPESCTKRAIEHSKYKYSEDLISNNEMILASVIQLCDNYSLQLWVVNTPKKICYTDAYDQQVYDNAIVSIKRIQMTYSFEFIDFWKDPEFTDEDFADSDHLNKRGAKKFLQKVLNN